VVTGLAVVTGERQAAFQQFHSRRASCNKQLEVHRHTYPTNGQLSAIRGRDKWTSHAARRRGEGGKKERANSAVRMDVPYGGGGRESRVVRNPEDREVVASFKVRPRRTNPRLPQPAEPVEPSSGARANMQCSER
jgi:hypothetical protein